MRYLLDTHAFLWWILDDPRLSPRAREIISDPQTTVFFSVVSAWEIAIKARLGRIKFTTKPLDRFLQEQLQVNNFHVLPVLLHHVFREHTLPPLHRDPFDRMLIAQTLEERLTLITADAQIKAYNVPVVW